MQEEGKRKRDFCYVVDGVDYTNDHPRITGGEIMDTASIPREVGLILVSPDGTQRVVPEDEIINLAELHGKFKRCPTFIRG